MVWAFPVEAVLVICGLFLTISLVLPILVFASVIAVSAALSRSLPCQDSFLSV